MEIEQTKSSNNPFPEIESKSQEPPFYKIILHNDDYTTMEFVVYVLIKFFNKTKDDAIKIMFDIHNKGIGIAGVYTFEVAETKKTEVLLFAKDNKYPLLCTMEPEK